MSHGQRISIFLLTVDLVGLKVLPVQLLIVSTLPGTELGLIWLYHLKSSSTVKLEVVAMVVILEVSINMLSHMVFLKKVVRITWLRILIILVAQTFRSVRTVLTLREPSQEIKVTVGQLLSIQSGKSINMELSQELII
jgi:hypothetical protein